MLIQISKILIKISILYFDYFIFISCNIKVLNFRSYIFFKNLAKYSISISILLITLPSRNKTISFICLYRWMYLIIYWICDQLKFWTWFSSLLIINFTKYILTINFLNSTLPYYYESTCLKCWNSWSLLP